MGSTAIKKNQFDKNQFDNKKTLNHSFATGDVHAVCDQAEIISNLLACQYKPDTSEIEVINDRLFDRLNLMGDKISQKNSKDIAELKCKIRLWKTLAPECLFNLDGNTVEENLLVSIIDDVLALH